jgi:hypothetical protein
VTVALPGSFGIVLRISEKTKPFVDGLASRFTSTYPNFPLNTDGSLAGFRLAMAYTPVPGLVEPLQRCGCTEGVDYVLTSSDNGVLGPTPNWLGSFRDELTNTQRFFLIAE